MRRWWWSGSGCAAGSGWLSGGARRCSLEGGGLGPLIDRLSSDFLPLFLGGMAVNFEIATIAIAVGLALGLLLALARLAGGIMAGAAAAGIGAMGGAPAFVGMVFLLEPAPRRAPPFRDAFGSPRLATVPLS